MDPTFPCYRCCTGSRPSTRRHTILHGFSDPSTRIRGRCRDDAGDRRDLGSVVELEAKDVSEPAPSGWRGRGARRRGRFLLARPVELRITARRSRVPRDSGRDLLGSRGACRGESDRRGVRPRPRRIPAGKSDAHGQHPRVAATGRGLRVRRRSDHDLRARRREHHDRPSPPARSGSGRLDRPRSRPEVTDRGRPESSVAIPRRSPVVAVRGPRRLRSRPQRKDRPGSPPGTHAVDDRSLTADKPRIREALEVCSR
jgi:hypothetical protein